LLKKIKEVDDLITPERQRKLREAHPELAFQRLNGGHALPKKHSSEGLEVRRRLLLKNGFSSVDRLLASRIGEGAKADDVLDACVCAIVAKDASTANRFPRKSQGADSRGLNMEIWF
jgi:predicted RNase H-like nuclease